MYKTAMVGREGLSGFPFTACQTNAIVLPTPDKAPLIFKGAFRGMFSPLPASMASLWRALA
jgi:hypothetical protein